VQLLALLVAGALLSAGRRDLVKLWLEQGTWIAASAFGLAWVHLPLSRALRRRCERARSGVRPGT
jgi:hypothetical protein